MSFTVKTVSDYENGKISLIGALRVWRNLDHEDSIVFTRNEVIVLLKEIDAIPR